MQRDEYSPFKMAHHRDRLERLARGELVPPTQVQIDPTNRCNHNCAYCFYRCAQDGELNATFNPTDQIPEKRLLELVDEFAAVGVHAVQYTGGGEPLLHPAMPTVITRTLVRGLELALVTNGTLLTEDIAKRLHGSAWVRVSLDAANENTYAESQGVSKKEFGKALGSIQLLLQHCPDTTVGVSFVVNPINWREIVAATELAKRIGAHNIRLSAAYTPTAARLFKDNWAEIENLSAQAARLATASFTVFNLASEHIDNLALRHKGYSECGYQHFTGVIGADLVLYPCCTLKYNRKAILGSVSSKKDFAAVWYGLERRAWLKSLDVRKTCAKACWMDKKNQFYCYLINERPRHVNFV